MGKRIVNILSSIGLVILLSAFSFQNQDKGEVRKLKYVYASNGGLIGYFNDGTISACPRCDAIQSNVNYLYKIEPHSNYTENDNCILEEDQKSCPSPDSPFWIMINYEWKIKIE